MGLRRLDKITISNDATSCLASRRRSDSVSTFCDWGWDMKLVTGLLAAVLLLAGVGASQAVVRIADDRGGRIGTYVDKYQGLRTSGETVIIDGLCASACTIVLGAVPHDRICVTSHATLRLPPPPRPRPRCLRPPGLSRPPAPPPHKHRRQEDVVSVVPAVFQKPRGGWNRRL